MRAAARKRIFEPEAERPPMPAQPGGRYKPPVDLQERTKNRCEAHGMGPTSIWSGVSATALARVAAGFPVQRGTIALLERAFEKLDRAARRRGEDGAT